ncbi:unnamed protein product [Sphagnum balticum]
MSIAGAKWNPTQAYYQIPFEQFDYMIQQFEQNEVEYTISQAQCGVESAVAAATAERNKTSKRRPPATTPTAPRKTRFDAVSYGNDCTYIKPA